MSYLVLARKYRPQRFEDVVAQEHITRTLQNSIKNDRIGSGYLFCGPRGTGKTTTARLLAKAVNCKEGPTPEPCGVCPVCQEITRGSSLDVLEIDAASNTGVDDVRTLRENVKYLPTSGKKRIYIIDEVHRLSGQAFDALLKTLEEPPAHVMFIFATTEPMKVPETILSRTQRFDFKRVSVDDLSAHLSVIAQKESLKITDQALRLIARKADGSVRDSLSLLDQVAAFASDQISEKEVIEALGLVDAQFLFDYVGALAGGESKKVLTLTRSIFDGGIDPKDFIAELLEHLRILLVLATDPDAAPLLYLGEDELEQYRGQVTFFSVGDLIRLMKMAADLNTNLKQSGLDERLLLEMTGIRMATMESTVTLQEVLSAIGQQTTGKPGLDLFNAGEKKKSDPSQRVTLVRPAPEEGAGKRAEPRTVTHTGIIEGWQGFLDSFRRNRPMLSSQLGMTEIREFNNGRLILAFPASGENSRQIVQRPENVKLIVEALAEYFHTHLTVRFEIDQSKLDNGFSGEQNNNQAVDVNALIENSPRLKALIEKVDGQVIGVKKTK